MKKKIFALAIVATVAVAGAWGFSQSNNEVALSDVALSNVEALAANETIKTGYGHKVPRIDCYGCPTAYSCFGTGTISC